LSCRLALKRNSALAPKEEISPRVLSAAAHFFSYRSYAICIVLHCFESLCIFIVKHDKHASWLVIFSDLLPAQLCKTWRGKSRDPPMLGTQQTDGMRMEDVRREEDQCESF